MIDFSGGYDEADGVLASQATAEASVYWVQATPDLDGTCTADAVDYGLKYGVCDSSLTNWSGSFSQMLLKANYLPDWRKWDSDNSKPFPHGELLLIPCPSLCFSSR